MTFPVDYDKFTILSKVRNHFTIWMFRRANITHKPTPSFGGYFSSVTPKILRVGSVSMDMSSTKMIECITRTTQCYCLSLTCR